MQILENISLKSLNSFGIEASARYFSQFKTIEELQGILNWSKLKGLNPMILGGGSNVLFTKNYDGLILKNELIGIEKVKDDDAFVYLKAGGGVVWHDFVMYCIKNNLSGIENLALIPGCVGASPMQNIGAYGVEVKDCFYELTAMDKQTSCMYKFTNSECEFGYRESVFKHKYKDRFVITDVTYRLNKTPHFRIEYGAIRQQLEKDSVQELTIAAIANAVMAIRISKLPDPAVIGNAGSFFKNPSVPKEQFDLLKEKYQGIVGYKNNEGLVKVAAGWMIDQCGLKGFTRGDAGVHDIQALVLVNHGKATGSEILEISKNVRTAVFEKFGIEIVPEVNII
jgi:UDP-N-acetylmuramate dehydrogenase